MTQQSVSTILPLEEQSTSTLLDWLHTHRQSDPFNIGSTDYVIAGPVHTDRAENPFVIALTVDNIEAWIEIPRQLFQEICALPDQEITLAEVPDAYRGLFFEAVLSDILSRLEIESTAKIVISHIYDSATTIASRRIFSNRSQPDHHIFGFEIQTPEGIRHSIGLKVGTKTLVNLCQLIASKELAPLHNNPEESKSVQCLYGKVNIKADALANIAKGDCLLVDKTLLQASFITLLLPDGLNAAGTLQENQIRLTSELQETMESNYTLPGPDEIQLNLIYGKPRISLEQATDLKAGSLVEVDTPESPIQVYTDKHLVARGQVVEIDKRLAIVVDELAA
ncbi:hypothetical protein AB833_26110 [Chromatiales bacterium (ex Bugula neritina AB1)]|nr:hypothetical protein AB833_26110 [Chromatiales bacterium (ex Bugula neritina AB1)]